MQAISNAVDAVREKVVTKPKEPEDWLKADQVEVIASDEDEIMSVENGQTQLAYLTICASDQISELIKKMIDHNFDAHQHKFRGTHVS